MQKLATALILLAPGLALAHSSNDLSHGAGHWAFSLHHALGMIILGLATAGLIWYFTRSKDEPKKAPVKVRRED